MKLKTRTYYKQKKKDLDQIKFCLKNQQKDERSLLILSEWYLEPCMGQGNMASLACFQEAGHTENFRPVQGSHNFEVKLPMVL